MVDVAIASKRTSKSVRAFKLCFRQGDGCYLERKCGSDLPLDGRRARNAEKSGEKRLGGGR